jgi:hypothetical protein
MMKLIYKSASVTLDEQIWWDAIAASGGKKGEIYG